MNSKDDMEPKQLLKLALDAAYNAYAPYSQFIVGAAVQLFDDSIFVGANMENASYGLTSCAEVGALQSASTAGKLSEVKRIAIVGGHSQSNEESGQIVVPCGRCRQLIYESSILSNTDIAVLCANLNLSSYKEYKISELLPFGFDLKTPSLE